ncbi:endolytic transglycosylase MltG [Candidatus Kaiserbacteria bacterium]|nr:endolytic transglycosylase MltG [Candidatus Kaiserbacteria bacterium]
MLNIRKKLSHSRLVRLSIWSMTALGAVVLMGVLLSTGIYNFLARDIEDTPTPFPVSVYPKEKRIAENQDVSFFLETHPSVADVRSSSTHVLHKLFAELVQHDWYQNLASPLGRILVIFPGERKEEIAENFGRILKWNANEKQSFLAAVAASGGLSEGTFSPGTYTVPLDATPEYVSTVVSEQFTHDVLTRYTPEVSRIVPLADTLTIASLIQREAYDFEDMRAISGVIWNRLFIEMNLQIDATLQYARGSNPKEPEWWPLPSPQDKYIDSTFNTYKHAGLPPTPISNPSVAAILAALNPVATDCIFYFHDKQKGFHCSATYDEHVDGLIEYYGSGR